jgi:hypothetical protein
VTWNVGVDGAGVSEVMAACGGDLQAVMGDNVGLVLGGERATTLGESYLFTLGHAGARRWFGCRDGGASACHDSKISLSAVIASSWETLVGGGVPRIVPTTTCKPCMILSSAKGTGTESYKWQNLTISKMT